MKTRATRLACLGLLLAGFATSQAAQVTFQVNMSIQTALGNFNPAAGTLCVAGGFNGWAIAASPLAPSPGDANLWTGTFEVTGDPASTVEYKFVMNDSTWEGNVGPGGPNGNRTLTVPESDQTLPVVYFNNVTSGTTVSSDVTFQVNLSVQIELGAFDPDASTLSVAGEFNGWSTSDFVLARSVTDPNLWVGTRTLTGAAGSSVLYKLVMNGTWEGNVGTGGAQNRSLTLVNGPQTLPVVFFNNLTAIPSNISLTFQLNLAVQMAQGNFDPATGTVSVAGDLLNNWDAAASVLTRSTTDPNVWTGTFDVSSTAGAVMAFKYVLNGSTWEGNVGPDGTQNRSYTIASTGPQTLPPVFFNNVSDLGRISLGAISGGQLTLSWTAGPGIRLQSATEVTGTTWQDVPNTLGQGTATVQVGTGRAFFKLVGP